MNKSRYILVTVVSLFFLAGVGCGNMPEVEQKGIVTSSSKSIEKASIMKLTIYEVKDASYRCDITVARVVKVPKTKAVARAVLESLKMTEKKSMAFYLNKAILIKDGVAYLDWKNSFTTLGKNTSCASSAFYSEINNSLTQFPTINKVIHSIEGDYQYFYDYMQTGVCPDEVKKNCSGFYDKDTYYKFKGKLIDVTSGKTVDGVNTANKASGLSQANFEDGRYKLLSIFRDLPDPKGSYFYEGWVVPKGLLSSVKSTGKVEKKDGIYVNEYSSDKDLTDHDFYVLTIEPDDNNSASGKHILEGTLKIN